MKELFTNLLRDEEGQGMVEYGIIIALISVGCIVMVKSIGGKTKAAWEGAEKELAKK